MAKNNLEDSREGGLESLDKTMRSNGFGCQPSLMESLYPMLRGGDVTGTSLSQVSQFIISIIKFCMMHIYYDKCLPY